MYTIESTDIFRGKHTWLCTLETWAEIGWMINTKVMNKIKEYLPIISHKCNMVSNFSIEKFKQEICSLITQKIENNEFINIDSTKISDNRIIDIFNMSQDKKDYLIRISIYNLIIYIWKK